MKFPAASLDSGSHRDGKTRSRMQYLLVTVTFTRGNDRNGCHCSLRDHRLGLLPRALAPRRTSSAGWHIVGRRAVYPALFRDSTEASERRAPYGREQSSIFAV
jgi:hypothetical protein